MMKIIEMEKKRQWLNFKSVFTALRKAETKADLNADAEGWFKNLRRMFGKTVKGITKKYLC